MRRTPWLLAIAAGTLTLTACGPTLPGAAAVVGNVRISDSSVAAFVTEYQHAANSASGAAKITADTVRRLVIDSLIEQEAARLGVTVTQGAVDQAIAAAIAQSGGSSQLASAALQSSIPPSAIRTEIRVTLLANASAARLAPTGTQTQQQQALLTDVTKLAQTLGTRIAPRYGSWDSTTLSIGADTEAFLVAAPAASG